MRLPVVWKEERERDISNEKLETTIREFWKEHNNALFVIEAFVVSTAK